MEFKFRAGDDRHACCSAQALQAGYSIPNLGRPGQLQNPMIPSRGALPREMEKERIREEIIASEILLRKQELEEEVRRDLAYEREVAMRRQGEQFSLQGGMKHKAKGEELVIAMKPGGSNNKASASSYPPPHKPYKPKKPAKQVSGGGVTANQQQSKPQNVVGKQPILHGDHCKVKCNSVPHLMGGKKQHVPMQAVSRHKSKNLFDSLGDLPISGVGKVPPSGPSSTLGKRPAPEPHHDPCVPKAKGKHSTKPAVDTDSQSMWFEDCQPPLPSQPSSSLGWKSSLGSFQDPNPSLGQGISWSPSLALTVGKSALLPSDMNLHNALSGYELVSTGVQQCLLGLQKWFIVSDRLEKFQKRVEDLEKELADLKAALRLAESNADASSKAMKIAEAQAVAAKSCLTVTEMELEALRSRQAEAEEEMRETIERSKDAQFEEIKALYLQHVEQIKALVFKRGYDVGLGDAGVPEDSHLWANYAAQSEKAQPPPPPVESQVQKQVDKVASPSSVVRGEGHSPAAESVPPVSDVPKRNQHETHIDEI